MGRNIKSGLDYFPLDVDFFEDDKLKFVEARFMEKGELIAIKLLCKIFKAGYFIKWDEDMTLLFSKTAGRNIAPGLANNVVEELLKRDFFNKGLFQKFAILTSRGIQKRYTKICTDSKRKDWQIDPQIDLLNSKSLFPPEEITKTPEESTQSKEKERKEKERRVKDLHAQDLSKSNLFRKPTIPTEIEVIESFIQNGGTEEMAISFFKKNEATGWFLKNSPIVNFKNLVSSYVENWNKNLKNGKIKQNGKHSGAVQPESVDTSENWGR